jgi:hypothetical protein
MSHPALQLFCCRMKQISPGAPADFRLRSPDAAQRAALAAWCTAKPGSMSDAQSPSPWVPALRSSAKRAAPRPGHGGAASAERRHRTMLRIALAGRCFASPGERRTASGSPGAKPRGACHRAAPCADPLALLPTHDDRSSQRAPPSQTQRQQLDVAFLG